MESRFSKYENNNSGKIASQHIANVNSYINWNYDKGLDIIEKEIADLQGRIDRGNAPTIFANKVDLLIELGKCIEKVHETYHFNRDI